MYYAHSELTQPPAETILWRYMDFTKFLAILENRSLYFASLASFDDPFEGHPPRSTVAELGAISAGYPEGYRDALHQNNLISFKESRRFVFASCWHMNESESAAMWSLYLRSGEGIAIRTTFDRAGRSIATGFPEVGAGVVNYVDYDKVELRETGVFHWATLKRLSFAHEREVRFLMLDKPGNGRNGFSVFVDLDVLVESIYLSPTTPIWVADLVQKTIDRFGLKCPTMRSTLNDHPQYYRDSPP